MKPTRIENKELLALIRTLPCCACGLHPTPDDLSHPHHVTSRGAGGHDKANNLMPLCAKHHVEWHTIGPSRMIKKYHGVYTWLLNANRHDVINVDES